MRRILFSGKTDNISKEQARAAVAAVAAKSEVGIPFPCEAIFEQQLLDLIDDLRGEATYAQVVGVLEMVKHQMIAESGDE